MTTKIQIFVWGAVMTFSALTTNVNASVNRVMSTSPLPMNTIMSAPDGEDGGETITWIDVTLESAGSLGVEVMYQVDKLEDVDYLKVTCSGNVALNAADWTSLKNMSSLKGLDLRQASFDAIPANEFDGRTSLTLVYLPEGMTTIGNYAFRNTKLTTIDIPASVTSIGQYAFYQVKTLTEVNFAEGAVLTSIGTYAFYQCTALPKFLMPNTVTTLGTYAFYGCSALSNLSLSSSLTSIPDYCFRNTSKLKNVAFPERLQSIGNSAFASSGLENAILPIGLRQLNSSSSSSDGSFNNCTSLKYLELPSSVTVNYSFRGCTALETVVCPSCTPPSVNSSCPPFYGVALANVTLKVPSFSIVDYKLDTYWLNFGTIEAMDSDPTYWRLDNKLSLTNNRRPTNVPDVVIPSGANCCLIVGGDAPFEVNNFNFNFNPSAPTYCRLVNRSPMTALGNVRVFYYVNANTWYFFTPIADVNLSDVTHGGNASYVFRYYDSENRAVNGTTNNASWKNVTGDVLKAGQGYIFHCNNAGWLTLHPSDENKARAFVSTDVTTELTAYPSENAANANWNYIGNPYPCYYDIYYMDFTAPITVRDGSNYKAYSIVDDNFVLAPMQSFFVQKPDGVNSILFHEAGRQVESTVNRASARNRSINADRIVYDFLLSDGVNTDQTRTIINAKASLDYELTCDAAKFMSSDEVLPQLYTIDKDGNHLAFNERPLADGKVKLGLYVGTAGTYTLSYNGIGNDVQLYDAETDKTVSLTTPYQFKVNSNGVYENRFILLFSKGSTAIQETKTAQATVTVIAGGVEVSADAGTDIAVYRADGSLFKATKTQAGRTIISLSAGLYIVKTGNKSFKSIVY